MAERRHLVILLAACARAASVVFALRRNAVCCNQLVDKFLETYVYSIVYFVCCVLVVSMLYDTVVLFGFIKFMNGLVFIIIIISEDKRPLLDMGFP